MHASVWVIVLVTVLPIVACGGDGTSPGDSGAPDTGSDVKTDASSDSGSDASDAAANDAGDAGSTTYNDLTQAANWTGYDLGALRDNSGATFDGRYVYFASLNATGTVTRYDTQASFTTGASWTTFDATTVNANARGFWGAAFDGRYVYLVPNSYNGTPHGTVTRYDTQAPFGTAGSWSTFDTTSLSANAKGFVGATFDGRYIYFVPYAYGTTVDSISGLVARYDTKAAFGSAASWSTFDATTVNAHAEGFWGAVFDGRYVYFVPRSTDVTIPSFATRYDTQAAFTSAGSWSAFDTTTVNAGAKLFQSGAFDGRYVYFVPISSDGAASDGMVTRYDTQGAFGNGSSWSTFATTALNANARGFAAAAFDGRYVYFVPDDVYQVGLVGIVPRYDTLASFSAAASWSTFDITTASSNAKGFGAAVFDGRYLYFAPAGLSTVARFDAKSPPSMPSLPAFFGSFF